MLGENRVAPILEGRLRRIQPILVNLILANDVFVERAVLSQVALTQFVRGKTGRRLS